MEREVQSRSGETRHRPSLLSVVFMRRNEDIFAFDIAAGEEADTKHEGYVKFCIQSAEVKETLQRVFIGTRRFFEQEPILKERCRIPEFSSLGRNINVGYAGEEQPQLYSVRKESDIPLPWPADVADPKEGGEKEEEGGDTISWTSWKESTMCLFDLLEDLSVVFLRILAVGISVAPSDLTAQLVETYPLPSGSFGSSNLLLNHFDFAKAPTRDPFLRQELGSIAMEEHSDKGLITIVPCADFPALQVLNQSSHEWEDVESEAELPFGNGDTTYYVAFVGDMLEQATAAYYRALLHRVPEKEWKTRVSLPFQLRARHTAVLHPAGLNTNAVLPISSVYRHPVTVERFLARPSPSPVKYWKDLTRAKQG